LAALTTASTALARSSATAETTAPTARRTVRGRRLGHAIIGFIHRLTQIAHTIQMTIAAE
jgi:hypothetical protein